MHTAHLQLGIEMMIARVPPGDINAVEDGLPVLLRLCTKGAQVHTIAHFDIFESIKTLNETSAAKQLLHGRVRL